MMCGWARWQQNQFTKIKQNFTDNYQSCFTFGNLKSDESLPILSSAWSSPARSSRLCTCPTSSSRRQSCRTWPCRKSRRAAGSLPRLVLPVHATFFVQKKTIKTEDFDQKFYSKGFDDIAAFT